MADRSLMEQKIALLKAIRAEAGRMAELIAQEAFEELDRCLDIRQGYMDRIDGLDRAMAEAGETAPGEAARAEMAGLLGQIQAIDRETSAAIAAALGDARAGIRQSNISRNLAEAYNKQLPPGSRFINNKG